MTEKAPSENTVLVGGMILTEPGRTGVVKHEKTLIAEDRLVEVNVSRLTEEVDARIVDCSHCLIMPGLINGHVHAAMSLLRGLADDLPFHRWLNEYIFPAESTHVGPEFVYLGTMISSMEMALNGITTFADGYFHMEHAARAAVDVGLRAVIAQGILDVPAPDAASPGSWKGRMHEFLESCPRDPLISPALFCHSTYLCSPETLRDAAALARELRTLLFCHVSETAPEVDDVAHRYGRRPVEHLDALNILGEGFVAVHAVHLSDREKEMLVEAGVGVVHCPESNMKLAAGACDASGLSRRGVAMGIGTDGPASNNNLDLFEEMRSASLMAKLVTRDPEALDARTVLRMATIDGARVLGMDDRIGSLEPGKFADVIVIDPDRPHLTPMYVPESHLVYAARGSDVRDVIVNGRMVVDHGRITTVDEEEFKARARTMASEIGRGVGLRECGE
ncbi:MAG: amidohydrolase family protein [Desulfomonilaceae bacterium]|nr:amidohydrolase family protein [Desulfomonilaceae bacterium]